MSDLDVIRMYIPGNVGFYRSASLPGCANLATDGLHILAVTMTDEESPAGH